MEVLLVTTITAAAVLVPIGWGFWFSFMTEPEQKKLAQNRRSYKKNYAHLYE